MANARYLYSHREVFTSVGYTRVYQEGEGPPFRPTPPFPDLVFKSARGAILTPGALGTADAVTEELDVPAAAAAAVEEEAEEEEDSARVTEAPVVAEHAEEEAEEEEGNSATTTTSTPLLNGNVGNVEIPIAAPAPPPPPPANGGSTSGAGIVVVVVVVSSEG